METALKRQFPFGLLLSATSRLLASSVTSSGMSEVPSLGIELKIAITRI